ncbi:MAG: GNAT family N-acetyltransferase [Chloroflexota bacterium]|nr:GNAT family N-acetyltransferase [Chloroflexota bacterium]
MTDGTIAIAQPADAARIAQGVVVQVNVSAGGVPKLPVETAWVDELGLQGDRHDEPTVHGGPYRAVCLYGMEAIARVRAEGHPIQPGGVGENLTTSGIEWSEQAPGTRVEVGQRLVLELTTPTAPCRTIRGNFSDGRFGRISIVTHASDSRMYARVVVPGSVGAGDPITLRPPAPGSLATRAGLLDRLDAVEGRSNLRLWRAAEAGGQRSAIVDDGELSICAAPDLPGPVFNRAGGLRLLPNLLDRVLEHFRRHEVSGWLPMHQRPWQSARPESQLAIMAAPLESSESIETREAAAEDLRPTGVEIRRLHPDEWRAWAGVVSADGVAAIPADTTRSLAPHLLATRNVHVLVAQAGDQVIGTGTLHLHGKVGLLRAGVVLPDWRGRGVQRALIAARMRLAAELGCDHVTSQAPPDSISERNLTRAGMERLLIRDVYRFDP